MFLSTFFFAVCSTLSFYITTELMFDQSLPFYDTGMIRFEVTHKIIVLKIFKKLLYEMKTNNELKVIVFTAFLTASRSLRNNY